MTRIGMILLGLALNLWALPAFAAEAAVESPNEAPVKQPVMASG
jgi:hypothetical protein